MFTSLAMVCTTKKCVPLEVLHLRLVVYTIISTVGTLNFYCVKLEQSSKHVCGVLFRPLSKPQTRLRSTVGSGGYKEMSIMSSIFADKLRPRIRVQKRGGGGDAGSQPMSTAMHNT
jgi:hypothetical protein